MLKLERLLEKRAFDSDLSWVRSAVSGSYLRGSSENFDHSFMG